ncbi:hypothetical protein JGB26_37780 [Streptomyces flavofungini]|uniref:Uncharacterized protein n=1 Tax=Streptomyces flavofungini TaxID=68200 RepID=A0ABS0XHQ9_9ACTN|nr:hypothetical protein [Streptomyces flavofungini]MBJ3812756.1 hypothetical protein [Streptomyces flavofungini]
MTEGARQALQGLDEEASAGEVTQQPERRVSPAVTTLTRQAVAGIVISMSLPPWEDVITMDG